MKRDNYIVPEQKSRWGFGGSKDKITIGEQNTKADGSYTESPEPEAARKNGGGTGGKSTAKASE